MLDFDSKKRVSHILQGKLGPGFQGMTLVIRTDQQFYLWFYGRKLKLRTAQTNEKNLQEQQQMLIDQQKNITCTKDTAITTTDVPTAVTLPSPANPFEDQTPTRILTRFYKVYEFNITPSFSQEMLRFPGLLFNIPVVRDALSSFYYFRGDVEISIKLSSTPYHSGAALVGWTPDTSFNYTSDIMALSAHNPIVLNYSSSDCIDLTFHWVKPDMWTNANGTTPADDTSLGILYLMPLVAVGNTSGNSLTIPCTVFARFKNPQVAGFIVPGAFKTNTTTRPRREAVAKGKAQMNIRPTRPQDGGVSGEQAEKSETGLQTAQAGASVVAPLFESIPIVGNVYQEIASAVKTVADFLDKPRSLQVAAKMVPFVGTDISMGAGLDNSDRLSLYPTSRLATTGIFEKGCFSTKNTTAQLAGIPMLHHRTIFTGSTLSDTLGLHPNYRGYYNGLDRQQAFRPDYFMYVASNYRFWRGSIKYMLHFICDAFTTARFRISYYIDPTTDTATGGDFPSIIIDVKGSTLTTVQVPFLWHTPYRPFNWFGEDTELLYPSLKIEQITASIAFSTATPVITCIIWRGAGEDIQFNGLTECSLVCDTPSETISPPKTAKGKAQMNIQTSFQKKFDWIGCECTGSKEQGYVTSESNGPIIDTMRRYVTRWLGAEYARLSFDDFQYTEDDKWRPPFYAFALLFRYHRGSLRFKGIIDPAAHVGVAAMARQGTFIPDGSAGMTWTTQMKPILEWEIPFYAARPYIPCSWLQSTSVLYPNEPANCSTDPLTNELISAGEDYQMALLVPPPQILPGAPPSSLKN